MSDLLKVKRLVKFNEKISGNSEAEINEKIIKICEEVARTGDTSAFSLWFPVDGKPGNWYYPHN
jgi:hypothetical protein